MKVTAKSVNALLDEMSSLRKEVIELRQQAKNAETVVKAVVHAFGEPAEIQQGGPVIPPSSRLELSGAAMQAGMIPSTLSCVRGRRGSMILTVAKG